MTQSRSAHAQLVITLISALCLVVGVTGLGLNTGTASAAPIASAPLSAHAGFSGWSSARMVAPVGQRATTTVVIKGKARSTVLVQRKLHGKWRTWKRIQTGSAARTTIDLALPVASSTRAWRLKLVPSYGRSVVSSVRRVVPLRGDVTAAAVTRYVRIGSSSLRIYGLDVYRPANSLVIYTAASGSASPANQWGVEASVVNGVVRAVSDRATTGAGATPIPVNGVLLSGHGRAGEWLLAKARVGTEVALPPGVAPTAGDSGSTTTDSGAGTDSTQSGTQPGVTQTGTTQTSPTAPPPATPTTPSPGVWKSGAAGNGVADGRFGTWRGTPVAIAGTWNDSYEAQTAQWSILPGAEFGAWSADIDIAVGAIYSDRGETWAAAAAGSYDARWSKALTAIKTAWGARTGTVHIRFAHEFNGEWVPWKVTGSTANDFVTAWKRFRALQLSIMPTAKLVFCPNDGSSKSLALDWRRAFPGAAHVDEMSVDSYNQYPFVNTSAAFTSKINAIDGYGAPVGIEKHRQFAASVGLPLAISEWNTNAAMGDADGFVRLFRDWVAANAGTGPGQVPYEIAFNVVSFGSGQFALFPSTSMPKAAASYVASF